MPRRPRNGILAIGKNQFQSRVVCFLIYLWDGRITRGFHRSPGSESPFQNQSAPFRLPCISKPSQKFKLTRKIRFHPTESSGFQFDSAWAFPASQGDRDFPNQNSAAALLSKTKSNAYSIEVHSSVIPLFLSINMLAKCCVFLYEQCHSHSKFGSTLLCWFQMFQGLSKMQNYGVSAFPSQKYIYFRIPSTGGIGSNV
jgi:hypothetical protein